MAENTKRNWKSVQEVAAENNCDARTVQKWCAENNVPYSGEGFRKTWKISARHEAAFKSRPKPGRRWTKKNNPNIS
jgi:hypothetical protein